MLVILLETREKLGSQGDVVEVKAGYARNCLLPQKKAMRANAKNLEFVASHKHEMEAINIKQKTAAEKIAAKMVEVSLIIVQQASDSGFLFGSVRASDIVMLLAEQGFVILKQQVKIDNPIKLIGNYMVKICLHPEVVVEVSLRVMTMQEQGSNVLIADDFNSNEI